MIDLNDLLGYVIKPTLQYLGPEFEGRAAENLLVGTALVESYCAHLNQTHEGPARSIYQVEREAHEDLWKNWLKHRHNYTDKLMGLVIPRRTPWDNMHGNLYYSTAWCRLNYYRRTEPLPFHSDIVSLGRYWKLFHNTLAGKGDQGIFVSRFNLFAKDLGYG